MRVFSLGLAMLAVMMTSAAVARERKATAAVDPDKIICRSEDNTGSRLAKTKRCMSARDWAAEKAANQQDIERVQANRYKNN